PPWMRLLVGPTASEILKRLDSAPHTATLADVAVLSYLLSTALVRGAALDADGRLNASQLRDLERLRETVLQLRGMLDEFGVSSDKAEEIAFARLSNPDSGVPEREVEILLAPEDEDSRMLVERVVALYQPVFRHEPKVTLRGASG